jgi:CDP-paratose 2-epimerase
VASAVVTGAGGLVGAEAAAYFCLAGYEVLGLENDMRATFFGPGASTMPQLSRLVETYDSFRHVHADIRDGDAVDRLFAQEGHRIELVVHAAAQPSHDWAAGDPLTDFSVNAEGTLVLLEATRRHCPDATFVFVSTNKVYGDSPNSLPLVELETRLELPAEHPWHGGVDTSMPLDRSLHSLFGVSKAAADLLVQEYGRYFGIPTCCFRAGCITGPLHAGARLHGFLSYLMRCTVSGEAYTVCGYRGRQVRDNLHSADLVRAFAAFHAAPRQGAVYNIGGGRHSNCSMLEAIELCERIAERRLDWRLSEEARLGDHRWWITDLSEFQADYPAWSPQASLEQILRQIHHANVETWTAEASLRR